MSLFAVGNRLAEEQGAFLFVDTYEAEDAEGALAAHVEAGGETVPLWVVGVSDGFSALVGRVDVVEPTSIPYVLTERGVLA